MAAASIMPSSPRGAEGALGFPEHSAAGTLDRGAADLFAKQFQQEVRRVATEFCRVELAVKRGYQPVSHAWDGFVKFALDQNAVSEGLLNMLVCDWLAEDMHGHVHEREMQRAGCIVIAVCCTAHEENREMMASRGLLGAAIRAMVRHPLCPNVHIAALQAILALCRNESNLTRAWDFKVLSTVGKALEAHRRVLEVQRLGRQVLGLFTGGGFTNITTTRNQEEDDHQKKRRRGDNESLMEGDRKESSDGAESNEDCETCIICMQESRTHAFLPCGHLCVCRSCAATVQEHKKSNVGNGQNAVGGPVVKTCCPVCRAPSTGATRIYRA